MPGTASTTTVWASSAISISSCPTPTVSTSTTSLPMASSTATRSAVERDRPPRWPRVPSERMKTPSSVAWSCMRMRSPRMAPPVKGLVGSTAMTPTVRPARRWAAMSRSVRVDFPAPGAPVRPTTQALPVLRPELAQRHLGRGEPVVEVAHEPGRRPHLAPQDLLDERGGHQ